MTSPTLYSTSIKFNLIAYVLSLCVIISIVVIHFLCSLYEEDLRAQEPYLSDINIENQLVREVPS